jgi:predicted Rossmann-fold nucleotide-binding protein
METWDERLFELIRLADGFAVCKGGTGTLVELAVAWEMLNKSVIAGKPIVVVGDFWQPILDRVREVEQGPGPSTQDRVWGEANGNLVYRAANPTEAAKYLADRLQF